VLAKKVAPSEISNESGLLVIRFRPHVAEQRPRIGHPYGISVSHRLYFFEYLPGPLDFGQDFVSFIPPVPDVLTEYATSPRSIWFRLLHESAILDMEVSGPTMRGRHWRGPTACRPARKRGFPHEVTCLSEVDVSKRSSLLLLIVLGLFATVGLSGCSTQAGSPSHGLTPSGAPSAAQPSQPRDSQESTPAAAKNNAGKTAGLTVIDEVVGEGPSAKSGDRVTVHYTVGSLMARSSTPPKTRTSRSHSHLAPVTSFPAGTRGL